MSLCESVESTAEDDPSGDHVVYVTRIQSSSKLDCIVSDLFAARPHTYNMHRLEKSRG